MERLVRHEGDGGTPSRQPAGRRRYFRLRYLGLHYFAITLFC